MTRVRFTIALTILGAIAVLLLYSRGKIEVSALPGARAGAAAAPHAEHAGVATPRVSAISSPIENTPSPNAPFESKAFCLLKKANLGIPLGGKIKIVAFPYGADEDNVPGFVAYVSSTDCPENSFSKIRMDSFGRTKTLLDCRTTNNNEIEVQSGIQGNIKDAPSTADTRNFAVSSEGFFVTRCDDEIVLQRSGNFQFSSGKLQHGHCEVLDRSGEPISEDVLDLDKNGCLPSGTCLALSTIAGMQGDPRDRTSIAIGDAGVQLQEGSFIFSNSLEDFSDAGSGPFGPRFKDLPGFHTPETCD